MHDLNDGVDAKRCLDNLNFNYIKVTKYRQQNIKNVYDPDTLSVSVTHHPKWGRTHRIDESYDFSKVANISSDQEFNLIEVYVQCSSQSQLCSGDCGILLKSLDNNIHTTACPKCKIDLHFNITCSMCNERNTQHWYSLDDFENVCRACYQYYKQHGKFRSKKLVARQKSKSPYTDHLKCKWQMKLVKTNKTIKGWKVYKHVNNNKYHSDDNPVQTSRRPTLSTRDTWDTLRSATKTTANQIAGTQLRKNAMKTNKDVNYCDNLRQIQNRCSVIDKHEIQIGMGTGHTIRNITSDWRKTELILEHNYQDVLLFQRGNNDLNRQYHIVLASEENLNNLRSFGESIIGYDIKQDFNDARFKTGFLTYADTEGWGRTGAISISNVETEQAHKLHLQVVFSNIPCKNKHCQHERQLFIFNDRCGFLWYRPCSAVNPLKPMVQHDKALDIRQAVRSLSLSSNLCNFHALQAFRNYIRDDPNLHLFIRPLEIGFKGVMRSWDTLSRNSLIDRYKTFIESISNQLLAPESKLKLIQYLDKYWFCNIWKDTFTASTLSEIPVLERSNSLIYTNNLTERKFLDVDVTENNKFLNKSLASIVWKFIDRTLPRDIHRSKVPTEKNISQKQRKLRVCQSALQIIKADQLITLEGWKNHGWILVKKGRKGQLGTNNLPDTYFLGTDGQTEDDILYSKSQALNNLQKIEEQITSEHTYDVSSKCKNLTMELSQLAYSLFKEELITHIPDAAFHKMTPSINVNMYHIVNIYLCVCSCSSFILKGQHHHCKHLLASIAFILQEKDINVALGMAKTKSNEAMKIVENPEDLLESTQLVVPCWPEYKNPSMEQKGAQFSMVKDILSNSYHVSLGNKPEFILKELKSAEPGNDQIKSYFGKRPKRAPHNAGFRKASGPTKDSNYTLIDSQTVPEQDPYKPNVIFPSNARQRHGGRPTGRKAIRSATRVNYDNIIFDALKKMSIRAKKSQELDSSQNVNTQSSPCEIPLSYEIPSSGSEHELTPSKVRKEPVVKKRLQKKKKSTGNIMCYYCIASDKRTKNVYRSQKDLDEHIKRSHNQNVIVCAQCYNANRENIVKFKNEVTLREHNAIYHQSTSGMKLSEVDSTLTNVLSSSSSNTLSRYSNYQGQPGLANLSKLKNKYISASKRKLSANELLDIEKSKKIKTTDKANQINHKVCKECTYTISPSQDHISCNQCQSDFHVICSDQVGKSANFICTECEIAITLISMKN